MESNEKDKPATAGHSGSGAGFQPTVSPANHLPQPTVEDDIFYDAGGIVERRRNILPHWHQEGKLQFVTFRLNDSLPQTTFASMEEEKEAWLRKHSRPWSEAECKEYSDRFALFIDRWLDANHGSCVLRQKEVAALMEEAMLYFNGRKYVLHDYVIMPNHVRVFFEVLGGHKLHDILYGWKSFSATVINKLLNRKGVLWRRESFDRLVRDEGHYMNVRRYILKNIKAGGVRWMRR